MAGNSSALQNQNLEAIQQMSFEQALSELEQIVRKLESGQGELDQSIEDYTKGTALKNHCQKKLEDARLKVEKLIKQPDGSLTSETFNTENNE